MSILAQSVHTHTSIAHTPAAPTAPDIDNRAGHANPESLLETFFQDAPALPAPGASQAEVWDWYNFTAFASRGGADTARRMAANILGGHTDGTGYAWMDDKDLRRVMTRGGFDIDLSMLRWLLEKMEAAGLIESKRRCGGRDAVSVRFGERPAPPEPKSDHRKPNPLTLVSVTPAGKTLARRAGKRRVSVRTPTSGSQNPPTLTLRPACPHCTMIGDDLGGGCQRCGYVGSVTVTGSAESILTALVRAALVREYEDNEGDPQTVGNFQTLIDVAAAKESDREHYRGESQARAEERRARWESTLHTAPMPEIDGIDDPFGDWDEAVDANLTISAGPVSLCKGDDHAR